MCSYNKINGSYSCENEWTTNYLLKNELNFQGFGMSTQCFPSPSFNKLIRGTNLSSKSCPIGAVNTVVFYPPLPDWI